ncbi:MAG: amidase [Myxococcota bacterium]
MTKPSAASKTLPWHNIRMLTELFDTGTLSAVEIVDAAYARIAEKDAELQAFAVLWPERARAAAKRLDAAKSKGEALGTLRGIPIALKDLVDVAGEPTRAGTTALGESVAAQNAEVTDRLEAAGAVLLGKVKMTEGAFVEHHESVTPPVNPWNPERWTGISSSGSGVAVAGGLCTAALGTDTGGSIRYPSAACGLTGLKPTHGRVSLRGVFPLAASLDHIGPMGRSVDDVDRLFRVLAGFDPADPWSLAANPPVPALPDVPDSIAGLRIGVDADYLSDHLAPEVAAAIQTALDVFEKAGAHLVPVRLPDLNRALAAWVFLGSAEIARAHAETFPAKADQYGAALRGAIEQGMATDPRAVAEGYEARVEFSRRFAALFDEVDAFAAPVIPGPLVANTNLADPEKFPEAGAAVRYTTPFNLSGSPSLTFPIGFDSGAAPIGFQLVGPHLAEPVLLRLGAAYQTATDWHTRHPEI